MNLEVFLILLGIGASVGLLSGLFGVGGGIILVPALIAVYTFLKIDSPYIVHTAIATSLFTMIFTVISSSYKHNKNKNILWKSAIIIGAASVVSVFVFSKIAVSLPGDTLKKIFAVIVIIVGIRMLFQKTNKAIDNGSLPEDNNHNIFLSIIIGILSGTIAVFTGLGGGVFIVPLMLYLMKLPIKKAIGTSTAAILITAVSAVISYIINVPPDFKPFNYSLGLVDVMSALPIVIASMPFAFVGVYFNKKIHHSLLTKMFAVFILIVSVKILFF